MESIVSIVVWFTVLRGGHFISPKWLQFKVGGWMTDYLGKICKQAFHVKPMQDDGMLPSPQGPISKKAAVPQ